MDLGQLKSRYRGIGSTKVSIHATLAELLGTGIVVLVGTASVQLTSDATALDMKLSQSPFPDRTLFMSQWTSTSI
jgi:hypothetical protein